jgi:anti-sigma-K factor RskA
LNIKEYISSGILESYALGELNNTERLEVEKNLAGYPELQQELALIEETMEAFLMKAGREPRASVKAKIMQATSAPSQPTKSARVVIMKPEPPNVIPIWRYATAASLLIAVASSVLAYSFYDNWKKTEVSLSELQALNQQVAQDYNQVNQRLDAIESEMQIVSNPAFQRIVMKGTPNAPEALASVYWNQNSQEVYLSIQNLKALAQEQQYQLWAIIDGKPVDMGVFDAPTNGTSIAGLLKMKTPTGKVATFAVTIEPKGGKPSPTLETMQVAGNS